MLDIKLKIQERFLFLRIITLLKELNSRSLYLCMLMHTHGSHPISGSLPTFCRINPSSPPTSASVSLHFYPNHPPSPRPSFLPFSCHSIYSHSFIMIWAPDTFIILENSNGFKFINTSQINPYPLFLKPDPNVILLGDY